MSNNKDDVQIIVLPGNKTEMIDPERNIYKVWDKEDRLWYTFMGEKGICGAKKRQGEGVCTRMPVKGRNRCNLHGGRSLRGVASPRYRNGKYSRDLIGKMGERYEEARQNPDMLSMHDEIAVLDSRMGEILGRIDNGESGEAWSLIQKIYRQAKRAAAKGDQEEFRDKFNEIGSIINSGVNEWRSWDESFKIMNHRVRIVDSYRKTLKDQQQQMTAEEAMTMVSTIVSIVRRNVMLHADNNTSQRILGSISQEVTEYVGDRKRTVKNIASQYEGTIETDIEDDELEEDDYE